MVKLKLDAIKSSTQPKKPATVIAKDIKTVPGQKKAPQKKVEVSGTQKPIAPKNKISLGDVKTIKKPQLEQQAQIKKQEGGTALVPEKAAIAHKQIPKTGKGRISLGGIKTKKAVAKKQVVNQPIIPEKFPVGASCDLKNIELFPAYTSKFKKKQGSLLQEIKKLKRLPRTNKFFVISLVGATITGIALLFFLAPEKHNLDYYKTSLIDAYERFTTDKPEEIIIPPTEIPEPIEEENTTPDNKIPENSGTGTQGEVSNTENSNIVKDIEYYRKIKEQILGIENSNNQGNSQEKTGSGSEENIEMKSLDEETGSGTSENNSETSSGSMNINDAPLGFSGSEDFNEQDDEFFSEFEGGVDEIDS